jgi:hypothetical protein
MKFDICKIRKIPFFSFFRSVETLVLSIFGASRPEECTATNFTESLGPLIIGEVIPDFDVPPQ